MNVYTICKCVQKEDNAKFLLLRREGSSKVWPRNPAVEGKDSVEQISATCYTKLFDPLLSRGSACTVGIWGAFSCQPCKFLNTYNKSLQTSGRNLPHATVWWERATMLLCPAYTSTHHMTGLIISKVRPGNVKLLIYNENLLGVSFASSHLQSCKRNIEMDFQRFSSLTAPTEIH